MYVDIMDGLSLLPLLSGDATMTRSEECNIYYVNVSLNSATL